MKKAVMYGAGNIGRGFIGKLLSESSYEVCFIDIASDIVDKLNEDNAYPVKIVSNDGQRDEMVYHVSAINGRDIKAVASAVCAAELVATAVGINVLPHIVTPLCEGIKLRTKSNPRPLNIIICENMLDADQYLRCLIEKELGEAYKPWLDENLGLVQASIGRMVPVMTDEMKEGNILRVWAEPYERLPVDKSAFKGATPAIRNLVPFSPFGFYIKRKLFIRNMGHAMSAYLGYQKGYQYIYECVEDKEIRPVVEKAMKSVAAALSKEYDVPITALYEHVDDLLYRFSNKALADTVTRVGRDPIRKLGRNDRLIGAALYCMEHEVMADSIACAIASCLKYDNADDEVAIELQSTIKQMGVAHCVETVCGIGKANGLHSMILNAYEQVRKNYDVVAAGHICIDISPGFVGDEIKSVVDFLTPGRLINMDGIAFSAGGPVANTGFAMARLGHKVLPMANIGNDELGSILNHIIDMKTGYPVTLNEDVRTSYSVVLSMPGIDRIILHDPAGNNSFEAKHIDYTQLGDAKLFHFGYPPLMKAMFEDEGLQLTEVFRRAKEKGIATSLDMSLPDTNSESGKVNWELILSKVLPFVDVFLPSIEEALFMLDREEYNRIKKIAGTDDFTKHIKIDKLYTLGEKILKMGCAMALIKCGAKGVYLKTAGQKKLLRMGRGMPEKAQGFADVELFKETYEVRNFKSALAGGDTTIAGFLSAMLRGYHVYDCLRIACMTGALCCTTYDSISGLLPIEEIYELAERNPKRNMFAELNQDFKFNNQYEVWVK